MSHVLNYRHMTEKEQALAIKYLPKAHMFAVISRRKCWRFDFEDVLAACYLALCLATQKWNPEKGEFLTCLKWQTKDQINRLRSDSRPAGFKCLSRHPWVTVPTTKIADPIKFELICASVDCAATDGNINRILKAIDGLPTDECEIFNLVHIQGLNHTEAATALGISLRTVQNRLNRGIFRLSQRLNDLCKQ